MAVMTVVKMADSRVHSTVAWMVDWRAAYSVGLSVYSWAAWMVESMAAS